MGSHFIEEQIVEEIVTLRSQVLQKFSDFENQALKKRDLLVQSCRLQHFNRSSKELDISLNEILEIAEKVVINKRSSETLKKTFKTIEHLKHEVLALERSLKIVEETSLQFERDGHFASSDAIEKAGVLRKNYDDLLALLNMKKSNVQRELDSCSFIRKCDVILDWIHNVKRTQWNPENNRILFDEMRKNSVLWVEIKQIFENFENPNSDEENAYGKLEAEWKELEKFLDSISKEMDEHERVLQFIENVDDIRNWIDEKEKEMKEKYSKMDLEESMKYRKTIEIEIETTRRRVRDADNKREEFDDEKNGVDLKDNVEKTSKRFEQFELYMDQWKIDIENRADLETFLHEADDILFWCSEKMEDLKNMKLRESMDCDEIAVWVETNNFDFISWDIVVSNFMKNGKSLIDRNIEVNRVNEQMKDVTNAYEIARKESDKVNAILEEKIKTICLEKTIFQTHNKASHLVSVLKNDWKTETSEQTEKILLMNDGLALRCISVVTQIESIEKEVNIDKLSSNAAELVSDLSIMKDILRSTCKDKKDFLTQKLDIFYLLDNSEELKDHTDNLLHNLKTEIHRETKLKNSINRVNPLNEHLQKIEETFDLLKYIMAKSEWGREMERIIRTNIDKIRKNINELVIEQDAQLDEYKMKRELDDTANFVERVEKWIDESIKKLNEDETESAIKWNNLKQKVTLCKHFLSTIDGYKSAVEKRKEALGNNDTKDEAVFLICGIEDSLMEFERDLKQKVRETEEKLLDSEQINELNEHNDWIKSKIGHLSEEPVCDSLLGVQKLSRRYENDSEEIENRRKNINEIIVVVKKNNNLSRIFTQIIDEIERNWIKMKRMFDEKGGYLERMMKLFEYDEQSVNIWEWIREKMMFVETIEKREEEEINRYFVKKLIDTRCEVFTFEAKIVEIHKLLEDALIQPNNDTLLNPIQLNRFKSDLTKKQGEIESDYVTLKRMIEKKLTDLNQFVQESEIYREIQNIENWIEQNEKALNRIISKDEKDNELRNDLENKLDDVDMNLNRKRANLTEIKCQLLRDGATASNMQKIDDAFSTLNVFAFELERMRQKVKRTNIWKLLKSEIDDVIGEIQSTCDRFEGLPRNHDNLESCAEILKRRVLKCMETAKDVKAANADLAPKVYDLEENLEKNWNQLAKMVENRRKSLLNSKFVAEIESELIDLEHWVDSFNEEIVVMTGGIHDSLGVQIAIESICTWKEELDLRQNQLQRVNNLMREMNNPDNQDIVDDLSRRTDHVQSDLQQASDTIVSKHEYLIDFLENIQIERSIDRLQSWINAKRRILNDDNNNSQNVKTVIRKMDEIEKMMNNRRAEFEELKEFVRQLRNKPDSLERTEIEEKFENLKDEWKQLEEDLKKKEVDFNESMSQLIVDEEYEKVNGWIERQMENIRQIDENDKNLEKQQKKLETVYTEVCEFEPIYLDFMKNEHIEPERLVIVQKIWSRLIETVTVRRETLDHEVERKRILQHLNQMLEWFSDAEEDVRSINVDNLYRQNDCDKLLRQLGAIHEMANSKHGDIRNIRQTAVNNPTVYEKDLERIGELVNDLIVRENELIELIKESKEDLEYWKHMQEAVKLIDDEICWFKEISYIVSSSDVGQNLEILENNMRTHSRLINDLERRKSKTILTIDRAMEILSLKSRPALLQKTDEIGEKVGQMEELIENAGQLTNIRTNRLEKWKGFFEILEEVKEKQRVLEEIGKVFDKKEGALNIEKGEMLLADIDENVKILNGIFEEIQEMRQRAEKMSVDEMLRTKSAENSVNKLLESWMDLNEKLKRRKQDVEDKIENFRFLWKCDLATQCIGDKKDRISNLVQQKRPSSNFETVQYHTTFNFLQHYQVETIDRLIETAESMKNKDGRKERESRLKNVLKEAKSLQDELNVLEKKIEKDSNRKVRIQSLQEEYCRKATELSIWIEEAEEEVADIVCFQTKQSTDECMNTLIKISDILKIEKIPMLSDLELIEVELSEYNEDVNTFTWLSFDKLSDVFDKLVVTINERTKIVETEIVRHSENEQICEQAAELLQKCKNVLSSTKKELERMPNFSLLDQKQKLTFLINELQGSGMIEELEHLRNLMDSRYVFVNRFTQLTANGILVDVCHCLDLMSSMLRSVEQSIEDRSNSGITERQLKEFEQSFDYFDKDHDGSLDYESFELCLKSQGYEFIITEQTIETMTVLDPARSGKILKPNYMKWMVKNETTNVFDDQTAIEDALKSLDAKKLTDSMSRKEAEFFLSRIPRNTQTITEHVHLEYNDFVKSFY